MSDLVCLGADCPEGALGALTMIRLFTAAFLAILFLQSGIDKVVDRKGNLEWLTGHFAQSPLAGMVGPMLGTVTVVELVAGALSAVGGVVLLFGGAPTLAAWGAAVSTVALLMLFFGQRVAKDYAGAAVLVPYGVATCLGLWVLAGI